MAKKKPYSELLKDPRWQKKRLKVLERDNWLCASCGDGTSTLHVHHKKYKEGKKPWEYRLEMLISLCEQCHSEIHRKDNIYSYFKSFDDTTLSIAQNICVALSNGINNSEIGSMLNMIDSIKSKGFSVDDFVYDFEVIITNRFNKENEVQGNDQTCFDDIDDILKMFDED
jgi:hypothetical protein